MDVKKITKKQLDRIMLDVILSKKDWRLKIPHILSMVSNWKNLDKIDESNLEDFIISCEKEHKQRQIDYFKKCQTGEIQSAFTPTDKSKNQFKTITKPVIGGKYHLSWAFKGALFKLVKI